VSSRAVCGLVILLCGCSTEVPGSGSVLVRDSAGIQIAVISAPSGSSARALRLPETPTLTIGPREGEPAFHFTELGGAARLEDGSIVVVEREAAEVRRFDPSGRYVGAVAIRGPGPGRLTDPWLIQRSAAGDTLFVADVDELLIVLVHGPLSSVPLPVSPEGLFLRPLRRLADGRILATLPVPAKPVEASTSGTASLDRLPTEVELYLVPAAGTWGERVGRFPVGEELVFRPAVGPPVYLGSTRLELPYVLAAGPDRFYHARAERHEVAEYSPDGRLLRLIRLPVESEPLETTDLREPRGPAGLAQPPNVRDAWDEALAGLPVSGLAVPLSRLVIDSLGRLWLRDAVAVGQTQRWRVFGSDGGYLFDANLPASVELLEVGHVHLLVGRLEADTYYVIELYEFPGLP
jgi:hypothetical protein